jgi:hypothetical protein
MYMLPGSCIRIAFVKEGTPPHSSAYIEAGKSPEAHDAVVMAAKIIAGAVFDLVCDEDAMKRVTEEFNTKKKRSNSTHTDLKSRA